MHLLRHAIVALTAMVLLAVSGSASAQVVDPTIPVPTNVRVAWADPFSIALAWAPVAPGAGVVGYHVYRDGQRVNPTTVIGEWFSDYGLSPETPHVYTVTAVRADGAVSAASSPAGGTTTGSMAIRVPEDYPTIQQAIDAAWPGASIHVAPGIYREALSFGYKTGVTIKGQDANGCILDFSLYPGIPIVLSGGGYGLEGNTLSGFTIREAQVRMSAGDVLSRCVLRNTVVQPLIVSGGLVANCVFDTFVPTANIQPGGFLAAVNSIFYSDTPFQFATPPTSSVFLFNNDFVQWPYFSNYQGSGSFLAIPQFEAPGPPLTYFPSWDSPTTGRALPLGAEYPGDAPDVGVFEAGRRYTPQPPSGLTATFLGAAGIRLFWTPPPDGPSRVAEFRIYRATSDSFPPALEATPYASTPFPGFQDTNLTPGVTYYYQVRAWGGPATPPETGELLSGPTNTASAGDMNRPPSAANDSAQTAEDQAATIAVLANDTDPDGDPLVLTGVGQPGHGTASVEANGTVRYVPAANFFGADSFTYTVWDGRSGTAAATVAVEVMPVNDGPVAAGDAYTIPEEQLLTVPAPGILANDTDVDGDPLYALVVSQPTHGTLLAGPAGWFEYQPAPNFFGTDLFTYRASDQQAISALTTVTITVTPVNDPPVAAAQSVTTAEDVAVAVTLTATDADGDPLSYVVLQGPLNGTLTGTGANLTYTPAANYFGSDDFLFMASDGRDTSAPAAVAITVTPVNDTPVAGAQSVTTAEDTAVAVTLAATDTDGDSLSYAVGRGPSHGTLTGTAPNLTYTPAADYYGPDSFTFTASDGQATSAPATVTVAVTAVNDPPVATPWSWTIPEDTVTGVPTTGTDPDPDLLTYAVVSGPSHGALRGMAPLLVYTPHANYYGQDTITFTASDGQLTSAPATLTINITPVNDPPVAEAGPDQVGTVGKVLSFSAATSYDVDSADLTYRWNWDDGTPDSYGAAATHTWTTDGTWTVTLSVTDDQGLTTSDTLIVTTRYNLALGKKASADTIRNSTYSAAKAVDGLDATYWLSAHTRNPQWLNVDLGTNRPVSGVRVIWPTTYFARGFFIQVSLNGKDWTTVYTLAGGGSGGVTDVTFGTMSVRHVRLTCSTPNNSLYYGVAELEVYQ